MVSDYSESDAVSALQKSLNALSDKERPTAKIGVSNQQNKDARGAYISAGAPPADPPAIPGNTWKAQVYSSTTGYDDILADATKFFNETLTDEQAYHAHLTFDNADARSANIVVWYLA